MEIAGAWLIEMSELDAMTRAGNSAIKSFVHTPRRTISAALRQACHPAPPTVRIRRHDQSGRRIS